MTRDELINAIRAQTDLDDEDLPFEVVSWYLREAFLRTAARERRWPTHQAEWEYVVGTDGYVTLGSDLAEIVSVMQKDTYNRLIFADHEEVRSSSAYTAGSSNVFSLWGGKMYIWPAPSEDITYVMSGYRKPSTVWLDSPSIQVDLDERLHIPILHYGIALAYAQQEDSELEDMYMRRWASSLDDVVPDIMKGGSYRPIVLNGGLEQQRY